MTLEEFLKAVQPGLTLYGLLVTFSLFSFFAGRFLWQYEKSLRMENVEHLKDLLSGFREQCVEPIFQSQLAKTVQRGFELVISGLMADLYVEKRGTDGSPKMVLVEDERLKVIVSRDSLTERLSRHKKEDDSIRQFLSSKSGIELLDSLDRTYVATADISRRYHEATQAAAKAAYCFFGLSVVLLVGLVQILKDWPALLWCAWAVLAVELLCYAAYSCVRMELARRRLLSTWEEFQLHAKV